MARNRTPPATPERPNLNAQQKVALVAALRRRVDELKQFDVQTVQERFNDPRVEVLETAIDETLSDAFGHETVEYKRYVGATRLDSGPVHMVSDWAGDARRDDSSDAQRYLAEGKRRAISLLEQAIRRLTDEASGSAANAVPDAASKNAANKKIFIVHGHDEAAREMLARFLTTLSFEPIILHEQASRGMTIAEKLMEYADVGFAIVLLTPDDVGRSSTEADLKPRARQNVVLELGYFLAKLGRDRVCALKRGNLEVPSDYAGIVYTAFDSGGAWKIELGKELQAAGYQINWNHVTA